MKKLFAWIAAALCATSLAAQTVTVTGTVTDSRNNPLQGAEVTTQQRKTKTDATGKYSISATKGDILSFSLHGYEPQWICATQTVHPVTMAGRTEMDAPFFVVEDMPTFRGGDIHTFRKWVRERVAYPDTAKEKGIAGRVVIKFVVGKDGSAGRIEILVSPDRSLSDEVVRVLLSAPKWTPGKQRGVPVPVTFTLPVEFGDPKAEPTRAISPEARPQEVDFMDFTEDAVVVKHEASHDGYGNATSARFAYMAAANSPQRANPHDYEGTEQYAGIAENRFAEAAKEPLSTFSIDVDAASYANLRRYINRGELPPADAIRTEELVNYFSYDYPKPEGKDPVRITTEVGRCPWNPQNRLVRIGLKAREIPGGNLPASNFVFLIDVSGSMNGPARLGLVKSSLKLLVNNLREKDRVAIVVYAGSAGEVLPSTSGGDKQRIREALDRLSAGGSTAGGTGIRLAYGVARENFIKGGNNRVILCTDGDFNVGVSSPQELEKLIGQERQGGVFLTVLGYGMGNYKDNRLQTLAEKGNGNHAYIDNLQEANKTLVTEFGGTMYAVAKDVKLQIEFNPAQVKAYRLVGYESRLLNKEDFNDDTKDAGEMGAGHTVTAFYEVVPAGSAFNYGGNVDPLRYRPVSKTAPAQRYDNASAEMLYVKLRYKQPDGDTSSRIEVPLVDRGGDNVSAGFRFASAVAMFGQLLRDSQFKGSATFGRVAAIARRGLDDDPQGYRREFIRLAEAAKGLK